MHPCSFRRPCLSSFEPWCPLLAPFGLSAPPLSRGSALPVAEHPLHFAALCAAGTLPFPPATSPDRSTSLLAQIQKSHVLSPPCNSTGVRSDRMWESSKD